VEETRPRRIGEMCGVGVWSRPAGRPAAHPLRGKPGVGRGRAGPHERLGRHRGIGVRDAVDDAESTEAASPRARPAVIGEARVVRHRCGCGGSRAKPRECGPLTEMSLRLPRAASAAAPSARGLAGDLGGECDGSTGEDAGESVRYAVREEANDHAHSGVLRAMFPKRPSVLGAMFLGEDSVPGASFSGGVSEDANPSFSRPGAQQTASHPWRRTCVKYTVSKILLSKEALLEKESMRGQAMRP